MEIPLVLALWQHPGFQGDRRLIVANTGDLDRLDFDDTTSAVGVHPGPDYAAWKAAHGRREPSVTLYERPGFRGAALTLSAGAYPDIGLLFNFNDTASSVRFNAVVQAQRINPSPVRAQAIAPVPLVVTLYKDAAFTGGHAIVVENIPDLGAYLGGGFNDEVTSVRVQRGPNYTPGAVVELYRDPGFRGGMIRLGPGSYRHLGDTHGFDDVISAVKVR
jgi:hypothetical protein